MHTGLTDITYANDESRTRKKIETEQDMTFLSKTINVIIVQINKISQINQTAQINIKHYNVIKYRV